MRCTIFLAGLLASSIVPGVSHSRSSDIWCFQGPQPAIVNPDQARRDVDLRPVRSDRMAAAIRALRERSVVDLEIGRVAAWLPPHAPVPDGRYHLVRSTIFAPSKASAREMIRLTQNARFDVHWFAERGEMNIVTLQHSIPEGARERNIAMVLRTDLPVRHVFVACYPVH